MSWCGMGVCCGWCIGRIGRIIGKWWVCIYIYIYMDGNVSKFFLGLIPRSHSFVMQKKVDSVLGATVQKTLYSKKRRMVVAEGEDKDAVAIGSGWDILDNHQVSCSEFENIMEGITALFFPSPSHSYHSRSTWHHLSSHPLCAVQQLIGYIRTISSSSLHTIQASHSPKEYKHEGGRNEMGCTSQVQPMRTLKYVIHLDEPLKNIDGWSMYEEGEGLRESCLRQIIGQGGKGLKKSLLW